MYTVPEIKKMFTAGNLKGVMEALEERIPLTEGQDQHEIVHLLSRWNGLERNHHLGVIDPNDYRNEANRIRLATWDIIRDLTDAPVPREATGPVRVGDPNSLFNRVSKHATAAAPGPPPPPEREDDLNAVHLFISYARDDREYVDELIVALASLRANGWISSWTDSDLRGGDEWRPAIETNLRMADIVLYMVSADFLNSSFIRTHERVWAEEERAKRGVRILPVIVRPSTWELEAFSKYNVVPRDEDGEIRPISRWEDEDEAYLSVVQELIKIIKDLRAPAAS